MPQLPKISEAEWEIMNIIWQSAPLTAAEIIEKIDQSRNWNPKTVKSLIHRLVQKNAVGVDRTRRVYRYYPLVDREACVRAESRSFLQRIYGGALKPMLVHFLEEERLSEEDIRELKKLLDEKRS